MDANYMTPESQRIAIAEACGWERREPDNLYPEVRWLDPKNTSQWRSDYARRDIDLPDYLNDLNAMHEGVRSQSEDFRRHFNEALLSVARQRNGLVVDLTAKDWADCFTYLLSQRDSLKVNA